MIFLFNFYCYLTLKNGTSKVLIVFPLNEDCKKFSQILQLFDFQFWLTEVQITLLICSYHHQRLRKNFFIRVN
jgi:hypothetical protein